VFAVVKYFFITEVHRGFCFSTFSSARSVTSPHVNGGPVTPVADKSCQYLPILNLVSRGPYIFPLRSLRHFLAASAVYLKGKVYLIRLLILFFVTPKNASNGKTNPKRKLFAAFGQYSLYERGSFQRDKITDKMKLI